MQKGKENHIFECRKSKGEKKERRWREKECERDEGQCGLSPTTGDDSGVF
jgi:hypothetical protein